MPLPTRLPAGAAIPAMLAAPILAAAQPDVDARVDALVTAMRRDEKLRYAHG